MKSISTLGKRGTFINLDIIYILKKILCQKWMTQAGLSSIFSLVLYMISLQWRLYMRYWGKRLEWLQCIYGNACGYLDCTEGTKLKKALFFFFFFPREFPYTVWEGINTFELVLFRIMLVMSLSWLLIISQLILMILYCCNQLINLVKILIWFEAIGSCLSCLFNLEIE